MKARVFETLPNVVYLWSIRVYDGVRNPKVVSERYYKNQIFRTPLGQEAHPTFQESFQLPPGSYVVRVNLHQVSENFDLSKLTDEDTNRQTRVISGWKEVVIPR